MPKSPSLPKPLAYLQPAYKKLSKLSPEDLNEDVDADGLEAALRKRVKGLKPAEAKKLLADDIAELERWLKTNDEAWAAHWIRGFMCSPGLAKNLLSKPQPPREEPEIRFEAPDGWRVKALPFGIELRKRGITCVVEPMDAVSIDILKAQQKLWRPIPGMKMSQTVSDVSFDKCSGTKAVFLQQNPTWKRVDYLLKVPGGAVSVMVDGLGKDFDESDIESRLHTISVIGGTFA